MTHNAIPGDTMSPGIAALHAVIAMAVSEPACILCLEGLVAITRRMETVPRMSNVVLLSTPGGHARIAVSEMARCRVVATVIPSMARPLDRTIGPDHFLIQVRTTGMRSVDSRAHFVNIGRA